jgi:hypothetical protein
MIKDVFERRTFPATSSEESVMNPSPTAKLAFGLAALAVLAGCSDVEMTGRPANPRAATMSGGLVPPTTVTMGTMGTTGTTMRSDADVPARTPMPSR